MVSTVESNVNQVQPLRGNQLFKAASQKQNQNEKNTVEDKVQISSNVASTEPKAKINDPLTIRSNQLIQEINNYGDFKVDESDVKYALRYGRSILVNVSA